MIIKNIYFSWETDNKMYDTFILFNLNSDEEWKKDLFKTLSLLYENNSNLLKDKNLRLIWACIIGSHTDKNINLNTLRINFEVAF